MLSRTAVISTLALALFAFGLSLSPAFAQSVSDYAVQVSAQVQADPPQIMLVWPAVESATSYTVQRKAKEDATWGEAVPLPSTANVFFDTAVEAGKAYEYRIERVGANYTGYGYVYAGIELPLIESRGKVLLIVDNTSAASLQPELQRLEQDLVGDGWTVQRHDVPRMSVDASSSDPSLWSVRSNEVASLRGLIRSQYLADSRNVRAVFLLGHVPVPYSGSILPDFHADHAGAWPADVYYADIDGTWTDFTVTATAATDPRNHNVPGDGKFDQSHVPGSVSLEVGRVDLSNLTLLPWSEPDLLRQYLNKNHNFRHGIITAQPRGLINDNLNSLNGEVPGAIGWRNFAPLFGAENTSTGRWLTVLPREEHLWAYGSGAGTYSKANAVAGTSHILTYDLKVVFTMLFGSYFGDWDSENNLLRAQLAATTYTLSSAWVGRPNWYFHHMALGETIGYSTRLSQSNRTLYQPGNSTNGIHVSLPNDPRNTTNGIHIALMGDPTLRLHTVAPPAGLVAATNEFGGTLLAWSASPDDVVGYHVYRGPAPGGPFARLTSTPAAETRFDDHAASADRFYMVRAIKLQTSGGGTYYNASQGIFAEGSALTGEPTPASVWAARDTQTWTINDASGTPGDSPGWDMVRINGTLNVTATPESQFRVRIVSFQSDNSRGAPANFNRDSAYVWPILITSGSILGFDTAKVGLNTAEFAADLGGGTFRLALSDEANSVNLVFSPNHEPVADRALFTRAWDEPLRIDVADLLARFTRDPDGDPRALVQVGPSTNGTSIKTDSTAILLNFSNNLPETVPYSIQDVRPYRPNDTVRVTSGAIRIAPVPDALPFNAYHAIEIEWVGEPGKRYQMQSRVENESAWVNEGEPFVGTGEKRSLFQRTSNPTKFYRIVILD